jgi:hypothetical protein
MIGKRNIKKEQLENAEASRSKEQPLPTGYWNKPKGDWFSDLSGAHRRFYEKGKNYIGGKIGDQFVLFPTETEARFHELGYMPFLSGKGRNESLPLTYGRGYFYHRSKAKLHGCFGRCLIP